MIAISVTSEIKRYVVSYPKRNVQKLVNKSGISAVNRMNETGILYNKSNQVLMQDTFNNDVRYRLFSYQTLVLEIINGKITIDGRGKYSRTTSKHITQALSFLRLETAHNF